MSENLTEQETADRAGRVRAVHYTVTLDLTGGGPTFPSTTVVSFEADPGTTTWLDLIAERVLAVTVNGTAVDVGTAVEGARIRLPALSGSATVEITADCRYMNTGEGLHRFVDPVDNRTYLYTQFEVADARRVFAVFDQPDIKGTLTLSVLAPAEWLVASNATVPEPQPVAAAAWWHFPTSHLLPSYVMALVAGPYHRVSDAYEGRYGRYPLALLCRQSMAEHLDAADLFTITKQGMTWFEDHFGIGYPFGGYVQAFVPEFNAGAMENAALVTLRDEYLFRSRTTTTAYEVRANTILHELAHMWFGDLVTMRWWNDLWLNESFAEWAGHWASAGATRFTEAWTLFHAQRKAWAYRQDQLPSTHPIAAAMPDLDSVHENFDGITYAKGAAALRQLVAWVGEENFLTGLREYFARHAWGNTTLPDFLDVMTRASGRDLTEWSQVWLETSGVNTLLPEVATDAADVITGFAIVQQPPLVPPGLPPVLRPHRVRIGCYDEVAGSLVRTRTVELDVTGARTEVADLIGQVRPALLLLNDDDLTYAKIRLDDTSLARAVAQLGSVESSLSRALVWGAAWDMVRDAELATAEYVDLVLHNLPRESDVGLISQTLRQVRLAIDVYRAPHERSASAAQVATMAWQAMMAAGAGSDRQLAFARGMIAHATDPSQAEWLQGLLAGTLAPAGLAVDTDLRWALVIRLAALGVVEEPVIAAEVGRDDTSAGRERATQARAAIPTAAAKQWAWATAVTEPDTPNALTEALIAGFMQPGQEALLIEYRERYATQVRRMWSGRTHHIGQLLVAGLFPVLLIDEATLAMADGLLAATGEATLPTGAGRIVAEQRDSVARAMRARARDAHPRG